MEQEKEKNKGSEERWRGAFANLTEISSNLESLQKPLPKKAVFVDEETFAKASLGSEQARTIKVLEQRVETLETELDAAITAAAHARSEKRQAEAAQKAAELHAQEITRELENRTNSHIIMTTSTLSLQSIIGNDNKFDGTNFIDWYRNLRIILKSEKKLHIIDESVMATPTHDATQEVRDAYQKYLDDADIVQCLLLASMTSELQEQYENLDASSMITNLKELFQSCARHERYETSKKLFRCRMTEGAQVGPHVIKMIGYIQRLKTLGFIMDAKLSVDLVLQSLPNSFSHFILNYNMNEMEKTLPELLSMLKTVEQDMKKFKPVLLVTAASRKGNGKGKGKAKAKPNFKPKTQDALKSVGGVRKEGKVVCFYCGKPGHWRIHCKTFLINKKNNVVAASSKEWSVRPRRGRPTCWKWSMSC